MADQFIATPTGKQNRYSRVLCVVRDLTLSPPAAGWKQQWIKARNCWQRGQIGVGVDRTPALLLTHQ
ncbi:MAG: hypothetical protein WCP28_21830, partial [Actinomycetes bacterium]